MTRYTAVRKGVLAEYYEFLLSFAETAAEIQSVVDRYWDDAKMHLADAERLDVLARERAAKCVAVAD